MSSDEQLRLGYGTLQGVHEEMLHLKGAVESLDRCLWNSNYEAMGYWCANIMAQLLSVICEVEDMLDAKLSE